MLLYKKQLFNNYHKRENKKQGNERKMRKDRVKHLGKFKYKYEMVTALAVTTTENISSTSNSIEEGSHSNLILEIIIIY